MRARNAYESTVMHQFHTATIRSIHLHIRRLFFFFFFSLSTLCRLFPLHLHSFHRTIYDSNPIVSLIQGVANGYLIK